MYEAQKVAVGNRLGSTVIGIDNDAARIQSHQLWAAPQGQRQHRVLRRMFWLRACGHISGGPRRQSSGPPESYHTAAIVEGSYSRGRAQTHSLGSFVAPYEGFRLSPPLPSVLH